MNPIEAVIRRADATQQRFTVPGFIFGVSKKFGDDNGGVLVANLAYAAFVTIFPLLLILVTILGLVTSGDPAIRTEVLKAVHHAVPLLSLQFTSHLKTLHRSSMIGLITGVVVLVYGTTRLSQAGIFTMEQVWNLPGPARPGYVPRMGRSLVFLGVLGLGLIITTLLTGLNAYSHHGVVLTGLAELVAAVANAGMYMMAFRALTPKGVRLRQLLPGAITGGVAWTILQVFGNLVIRHAVQGASAYTVFATVLALLGWIYLGVEITVYAAEVNVVLARRLWPRAMVQPPLTEADRASMALQALQNQRRPEQHVEVTFHDRPDGAQPTGMTPRTPDDVAPPAEPDPAQQERAAQEAAVHGEPPRGEAKAGKQITRQRMR